MSADILPIGIHPESAWTPVLKAMDALIKAANTRKGFGSALVRWSAALEAMPNEHMRTIAIEVTSDYLAEDPIFYLKRENAPDV
jgi:hypothetical protein